VNSDVEPPALSDEEPFEPDDPIPPSGCRVVDATEPVVITLGGKVKLLSELSSRELSRLQGSGWVPGDPLPRQVETDSEGFDLEIPELEAK
jgi:hypothetical protein